MRKILDANELLKTLISPISPWIFETGSIVLDSVRPQLASKDGFEWVELNGTHMHELHDFWDEVLRAFSLPQYFGRNPHALRDCLTDINIMTKSEYLLVIRHGVDFLSSEAEPQLALIIETFEDIAEELSTAIELGEAWDRPPMPFHVCFLN
jgi:RNAse (barnase) inhibitor barstar